MRDERSHSLYFAARTLRGRLNVVILERSQRRLLADIVEKGSEHSAAGLFTAQMRDLQARAPLEAALYAIDVLVF